MTAKRKLWQTPALNAKSVREALGSGDAAGPMAPGLLAGPNPMFGPPPKDSDLGSTRGPVGPNFGPFGPNPGPVLGPIPGPVLGPTGRQFLSDAPVFGPALSSFPVFAADGPPVPSDLRLKEDVTPLGSTVNGLPLYTFRYRGQQALYQGVMAQDVLEVRPDAVVVDADGFYRVDYAKLGIEFRRIQ